MGRHHERLSAVSALRRVGTGSNHQLGGQTDGMALLDLLRVFQISTAGTKRPENVLGKSNRMAALMTMTWKERNKQIADMREELVRRFPGCFKPKRALKVPLAVGIREMIFERAPDLDRPLVALAIKDYVNGPKYQNTCFEGAPRYDLDGLVVGFVSANDAQFAVVKVASMNERFAKRDAAKVA
jgi:hypothetical protein